MRIVILGNSGSGKTTLARRLSEAGNAALLELDALVWEPNQIAVQRPMDAVEADLDAFLSASDRWVIEGCYGELAERALRTATHLVFLNPGVDQCVAHCKARPWEPEKYASKEDQDRFLAPLIEWVRGYETRHDAWSLAVHRRVFESFTGRKVEIVRMDDLEPHVRELTG